VDSKAYATGLASALGALALSASAQTLPTPTHNYKDAPSGTYQIDPKHTGLIARVPHVGFSISIFRFTGVSGQLSWNPANPHSDALNVTVDTTSIVTGPVQGFSEELQGEKYLNAVKFPTATFTSTSFRPEGPTHGVVEGTLTLMGVARPAKFDVDLIGTGSFFKREVVGVEAKTMLDPKAFGLPPLIVSPIQLVIDTEFDKQPS
jgi:polyisoprenoid-binding protein YceI